MRFVITGEWTRNRLLQTIVVLYAVYVAGLWLTNALLYFSKMGLGAASVVEYYLGSEERFLSPRSYQGLLEASQGQQDLSRIGRGWRGLGHQWKQCHLRQ